MLLMQTNDVLRRFGADVLFHNINLQINDHARVALVGRNGAGKTTLLKILAQITEPDEGTLSIAKNTTIGYLAQDQGLDSQNTVWAELDSVFAPLHQLETRMHEVEQALADQPTNQQLLDEYDRIQTSFKKQDGFAIDSKIRGVLAGFGFKEDVYDLPVSDLSGGQKTKLALAKILLQAPDLLILDEPTNHLDMGVLSWLEDYLKSYTGALLIVSHDRYFLDKVVSEVYDLDNRTLTHYKGNYTAFMGQKAERLKAEMKHYEQQQKEIAALEDFVNKNIVRASTTKRAQARRKQLEKMDRIEKPISDDRSIHFSFTYGEPSGNEVLEVDHLKIGYDDQAIAGPFSFKETKGQRIGIIGENGIGKSTLLKTILHKLPALSGEIKYGANLQIGYYDQEQQQLHPEKTVLNEVWDDHPEVNEGDIRTLLGSFLFVGDDVFKQVSDLSGGQKARLELTKLSFLPINFLVLDEPTNHLDIDSRQVLEAAINEFPGTVLFISHDRYFINQVATDILAVTKDQMTAYQGDYDDYLAESAKQAAVAAPTASDTAKTASSASSKQQSYQQSKETQRARRKLARQVDQLESQMTELSDQVQALEEQMADPAIATDIAKLSDLQKQLDDLNGQLEQTEEAWTEAAEALEEFDAEN